MENLERQSKISNLQTLETEVSLTKQEMEEFRKLPKEEQEKQKQENLVRLFDLQTRLDGAIQDAIQTGQLDEARELKERLEKEIKDLESLAETKSIQVDYKYTNPQTQKVERQETITLDIEAKLQDFLSFYLENNVDLPPDFENVILDIWGRNSDQIQRAIEQCGFNDILIIPPTVDIGELSEKMKMQNGYWDYIKSNGNVQALDGIPLSSINVHQSRIVLVHKSQNLKDCPELKQTLNIKGEDVKLDQALTLEDYLVFQKKYFKETGNHLDEDGWTWLATKSGARLVYSAWGPGGGRLDVYADDLDDQFEPLGARPSRSFF